MRKTLVRAIESCYEKSARLQKHATSTHLRRGVMTKAELIDKMAKDAKVTKAAADKAINSFVDGVKKALKKGEKVTLIGFGTFSVTQRKARKGRNPQTGKEIKIPARKAPKFAAGMALKKAVK